jgi:hypothetical protein
LVFWVEPFQPHFLPSVRQPFLKSFSVGPVFAIDVSGRVTAKNLSVFPDITVLVSEQRVFFEPFIELRMALFPLGK